MLKSLFFITMSLLYSANAKAADSKEVPFTIGTLMSAEQLMPYMQYSGAPSTLRSLLFPPVLNVGRDGKVRCVLCKEVPTIEVRKGTPPTFIISMELKKDLKWGDGRAIDAKDVKFTLEQMAKANYPKGAHPILPIKRIELDKDQPRKITLVLRHRRSDAFQIFAISLLPEHKAKELEGLSFAPSRSLELIKDPAYSYGTYKVESASSTSLDLVSNSKTEWENKPEQALRLRFYPSQSELISAMKIGEINQTDELEWSVYKAIKINWPELSQTYEANSNPSDTSQVLLLNTHSPVLVNPQLRQALFFAINRESLSKLQYDGLATPANGLITDEFAARLERERVPAFNLKQAARILEQAGWTKGPDGIRTSEGQKFGVSLICPKERLDSVWVQGLVADLKTLGIQLEVELVESTDYLKKIISERRFRDIACASWTLPSLSIPNNLFHSLAIPTRENNYFGSNYSAWDAHVVDKLLDNMLREIELHHFVRQFGRLDKQFMSDLPAIPIVYEPKIKLMQKAQKTTPSEELSRILQAPTQIKL